MRIFLTACIIFASLGTYAEAETVIRSGEDVVIAVDETVASDLYSVTGTFSHAGTVAGDVYAFGRRLTIGGTVDADVTLAAFSVLPWETANVTITGEIGDDVRVVAPVVTISGPVAGDVMVIAGRLQVASDADIAGDVYFFGGELQIDGPVAGLVAGRNEEMRIDASVGGVDVTTRSPITLGSRADIAGDVRYIGPSDIARAPEANITGSIVKSDMPAATEADRSSLAAQLLPIIIMLFSSLVLYLLARSFMVTATNHAHAHVLRSSLIGMALILATPLTTIILLSTVLGAVVGIGLFALYVAALVAAICLAPMVAGALLWRLAGTSVPVQPLAILTGAVVLYICLWIPVLGVLSIVLCLVVSLGAAVETAVRTFLSNR